MRILVTGGAGFIGSHLVDALVARGDAVVVYDNLAQGRAENLAAVQGRVVVRDGSVVDLDLLERTVREHHADKIAHVAAIASRDVLDPSLIISVNIQGTVNVLEAARRCEVRRCVLLSSDEVYGEFQYEPADEDHPLVPQQPYGISKLCGERFAEYYHEFHGVDVISIRTARVYGPRFLGERVPKNLIQNALQGKPTRMPKGGDDKADYTYVRDAVRGILLALDAEKPRHRVYNITGGKAYTTTQVGEIIQEMFPAAEVNIGPGPVEVDGVPLPRKGTLAIARARDDLGYTAEYDIRKGLAEYVRHLRCNPA
ncbi:MAG TPA: NAD-dependent epimerase/dehydratase family protein [Candidatus Methylomirabilis sp.]|nr:NAD-dependent epimerase/dehydratase family protein [Candidatus Methylomirabilis sp.]